jgi:nucleoside-diphosphate-sugar epimerase
MNSIAIVGAGGFVGTGLTESLVLDGVHSVRAVVRSPRSLAGLCRFGTAIETRLADAEDTESLVKALTGADAVVNVTTGPPAGIVRSTEAIYTACVQASVKRLVHLSSAVVFGDVFAAVASDDSLPLKSHWMPYARAKAAAENWLRPRISEGQLDVIVLRPGIVWGPRSPHTIELAGSFARKSAYLVDSGRWIFNGIFIENLIAAIRASCTSPGAVAGYYNVGDAEHVTWLEFYAAFAAALDFDPHRLPIVSGQRFPWSLGAAVDYIQSLGPINALYHRLKSRIPDAVKTAIKARLGDAYEYGRASTIYAHSPRVDRELWHLQRVRHKLPVNKFAATFEHPPVSFADGVSKTIDWLTAQGYGMQPPAFNTNSPKAPTHVVT